MIKPTSDQLFRFSCCWQITRTDGTILRFTDHDVALKLFDSEWYSPINGVASSARQGQQGLKDNNVELRGIIDSDDISFDDLRAGLYREAEVVEYVVDWLIPHNPPITTYRYWITETSFDGNMWLGQIAGQSKWLTQPVGILAARECRHDLGKGICGQGVNLDDFTIRGTILTVQKQRISFVSDVTTEQDGDYNDSEMTWVTGANVGLKSMIKNYLADGSYSLQLQTPYDLSEGDMFDTYLHCQHKLNRCIKIFGNVANFGGFPTMPGTDNYVRTPKPK